MHTGQMVLETLRGVLEADYRGPRAVFTQVHVLKALTAVGKGGTVGRGRLGELTGLGQGEVRTLIKRLRDSGFIAIEPSGCVLTPRGQEEYAKIASLLIWSSSVRAEGLNLGVRCWAVVVAGGARKVRYGIEQRDAAIKEGAEGAFTALFRANRFTVPGEGTDCEKGGPAEPWTSIRKASLHDGDAVVIAGSRKDSDSENGALAAALTLF
jgi:predicted transcriptional regulator